MTQKTPFHVYAEDGFDSAYATEAEARTVAERGSKANCCRLEIVKCDFYGQTGGGHGDIVAAYFNGVEQTNDTANLHADHLGFDGWVVRGQNGGTWFPDRSTREEIEASDDPEAAALNICRTAPTRGAWKWF